MKKVSEQIADWLVEQGVEQVFAVTGGGAMFLNIALGTHPKLKCTFMHHEQACAMAAEGYARVTNKPAVVMVTTGPGAINSMNGVFVASPLLSTLKEHLRAIQTHTGSIWTLTFCDQQPADLAELNTCGSKETLVGRTICTIVR